MENEKRMLSLHEAMDYTGLKQTKFRAWAKEVGALKKIGGRALYDKRIIDVTLDNIGRADDGEN